MTRRHIDRDYQSKFVPPTPGGGAMEGSAPTDTSRSESAANTGALTISTWKEAQAEEYRRAHAISEEVWNAQGCTRTYADSEEDVQLLVEAGYSEYKARQSDGFLFQQHPPPGLGLDPISPQWGPDKPVRTPPKKAWVYDTQQKKWKPGEWEKSKYLNARNKTEIVTHQGWPVRCYGTGEVHLVGEAPHSRTIVTEHTATRINMNPLAVPLFENSEVVIIVIEGTRKGMTVLSAILREGLPWAVCSVPSVWTSDPPELKLVAKAYFSGAQVIVLPDADGVINEMVRMPALLLREKLRDCGLTDATIYFPKGPADGWKPKHKPGHKPKRDKYDLNGIDDLLADGVPLTEALVPYTREAPPSEVSALALHGDKHERHLKTYARILGIRNEQVPMALLGYEEKGLITVERGSLATNIIRLKDEHGKPLPSELVWRDYPPRIVIHPDLRATDTLEALRTARKASYTIAEDVTRWMKEQRDMEIYYLHLQGVAKRELARRFNLNEWTIRNIIKRKDEQMDNELPTLADRVSNLEPRMREVERQLGLPQGGDPAVERMVEEFEKWHLENGDSDQESGKK